MIKHVRSRRLLAVVSTLLPAFALAGAPSTVSAGGSPDLVTTIDAPSGVSVYQSGRWEVTVDNLSSARAKNVLLTIDLPRTANSPTAYLMGTLGAIDSDCSRSGFSLVCEIGTVKRGQPKSVWFDITLPYSTNPISITASAPTRQDSNPADNSATVAAPLSTYAVVMNPAPPRTVTNTMCTGSAALSSFIECTTGSTQTFSADLLAGNTPNSGPVSTPVGGGTWTLNGTELAIDYYDGGNLAASFVGQGVGANCWEGRTTFPGSTQWVSIYRVCLA